LAALELGEHGDRLRIADDHPAALARLGDEVKMNLKPSQRHVLAPERGETNVAVVASVAVPADPKQANVEQSNRQTERPIAPTVRRTKQAPRGGADSRQLARELKHVIVLLMLLPLAPKRVIEVLSASFGIEPRSL
jgi:hypothetical protein